MNDAGKTLAKLMTFLPWTFYVICALLVLLEFAYHKHPYFSFEGWLGFYSMAGFLATITLVLIAQGLALGLRRGEDYYDR